MALILTESLSLIFVGSIYRDIISTTLRNDPHRPLATGGARGQTSILYARRLFADLEQQLTRDLSLPSVLTVVRMKFQELFEERVRLELLVLHAATGPKNGAHGTSSSSITGGGVTESSFARDAPSRPTGAISSSSTSALASASARARQLEEQLERHDVERAARVAAAHQHARQAREIERHQSRSRSRSPPSRGMTSSSSNRPSASTRFTAHVFDRNAGDSRSISSIESR